MPTTSSTSIIHRLRPFVLIASLLYILSTCLSPVSAVYTVGLPTITRVEMSDKNTLVGAGVKAILHLDWPNETTERNITYWIYQIIYNPDHSKCIHNPTSSPSTNTLLNEIEDSNIILTAKFSAADPLTGALETDLKTVEFPTREFGYNYFSFRIINPLNESQFSSFVCTEKTKVHAVYGWITLIPIFFLLGISIVCHQVLIALFTGIFVAATIIYGFNPLTGFLRSFDEYMVQGIAEDPHPAILLLMFFLSGLIGLITQSGGAQGMAQSMIRYITTRQKAMWVTFWLGMIIFFDDYASALIVGTNMRPITDLLFISREKLAFLVHSTAAPPSSLAPISSWIGFEVGCIGGQLRYLEKFKDVDPFSVFLDTIPTRFYAIFMLVFTCVNIFSKRDFGPMLTVERRAIFYKKVSPESDTNNNTTSGTGNNDDGFSTDGKLIINEKGALLPTTIDTSLDDKLGDASTPITATTATPPPFPNTNTNARWYNAFVPILVNILLILVGIVATGYYTCIEDGLEPSLANIAGRGDSTGSMVWASFAATVVAVFMYRYQKIMTFNECMEAWIKGIQETIEPILTLILAWTIGKAFTELNVSQFFIMTLKDGMQPELLSSVVFLTSCVISFCTGTSWGTMSIMFPLAVPLAYGLKPELPLIVEVISAILTGSIFGDQCSPISGTSILSALSSSLPVRDHVSSQLPYAVLVAFVSLLCGYIPMGYGVYPHWAGLLVGTLVMIIIMYAFGVKTESHDQPKLERIGKWVKDTVPGLRRRRNAGKGDDV